MNGNNTNGGYILLITVLIASVILVMALGMANTAYREATFGIQAKESHLAFFAADTGLECALAADRVAASAFANPEATLHCAENSISTFGDNGGDGIERIYDFDISDESEAIEMPGGGCAHLIVKKNTLIDSVNNFRGTIIESRGYNLPCAETAQILFNGTQNSRLLVERALRATYYTAAIPPDGGLGVPPDLGSGSGSSTGPGGTGVPPDLGSGGGASTGSGGN